MFGPKVFLNEGAYGKVFQTVLASNPMQQVAVKVMKKQNLFTLKHWRTVIREVEVHMRIKHPLAIQMIDVVQDDTMLYLVLELAKGGDAFDWVVKQQGIPERLAATVARNLLEFADNIYTSMHVVHRDLKLENILLMEVMRDAPWRGEDMLIKVADFGLAKFLLAPDACAGTAEKQGSLTVQMLAFDVGGRSGNFATPCGTLGYTAPEVLHPGSKPKLQNADSVHKLDVYSIGVILHILLTGAEPYPSSNLRDHLRRAARGIRTTDNIYRNVTLEARAILKRMVGPSFERPTAREALKTEFFSPPSPVPGTLPAQSPPTANITPTTETEFLQKAKKLVRMKEIVYDVTRDGIVVMRQLKNTQRRQSWNEAPALRSALSMDDTMQYYSVDLPLAEGVSPAMSPRSGGTPILPTPSPMQSPLNALDPSQVTSSNRNISPGGGANGFQARSRRHMSVNMGNISSQKRRQNFLSGMYNPVLKTKSNNNYM
jgi:serine/threonine protein kinase